MSHHQPQYSQHHKEQQQPHPSFLTKTAPYELSEEPTSPTGLSKPKTIRGHNEMRSMLISRSRFLLRLISAIFSAALLGGLGSAYTSYYGTRKSWLIYDGRDLWPDSLDMMPSDAMLAVGGVMAGLSGGLLVGGLSVKIRHISRMSDLLSFTIGITGIALGVFGVCFFWWYKSPNGQDTFWSWVCTHTKVNHPEVDFQMVCGEVRFSFAMGFAIIVAESLTVANVIIGCMIVKRTKAGLTSPGS